MGRLCVVRVVGESELKVRKVLRGYEPGKWNLAGVAGPATETEKLDVATPINLIKIGF